MSEIETFVETDRYRVGACGSLVIAAWNERALPEDLDAVEEVERRTLESSEVLNLIIALRLTGGRPAPGMKERGEKLQRDFAEHLVGQAVVLAGPWALAAGVVAITSALNMLQRAPVWTRTFRETDPAITWLAGLKNQPPTEVGALKHLAPAVRDFTAPIYA